MILVLLTLLACPPAESPETGAPPAAAGAEDNPASGSAEEAPGQSDR